ncbi:hypothetical protein [Schleiferilactobacillus harbinensis]|nr:hypothetical protein [Schleiferilactobacillus harbinensis]
MKKSTISFLATAGLCLVAIIWPGLKWWVLPFAIAGIAAIVIFGLKEPKR